jgi:hypothetical protein
MRRMFGVLLPVLLPCLLQAQAPPPAVLSHLRIGLDSATWNDVQRSEFLHRRFAAYQRVVTTAQASNQPRHLFFGRRQWLELAEGVDARSIVLGVSTEESSRVPALLAPWRRGGVQFDSTTVLRSAGDSLRPWYLRWRVPPAADAMLTLEVTAFHPAIFAARRLQDSLPVDLTDRARALAGDYSPDRIFSELTGATFAIPVVEIRALRETLRAGGIEVVDEGEGLVVLLEDGIRLRFLPAWERPGVRRLEFHLTDAVPANPTYRLGPQSRLQFGPGRVAVWDFDLP